MRRDGAGGQRQRCADGRADDQRHGDRRPDAHGEHQRHRRCRRPGRLQLPVGCARWGTTGATSAARPPTLTRWAMPMWARRSASASATPTATAPPRACSPRRLRPGGQRQRCAQRVLDDHRHGERGPDADREHQRHRRRRWPGCLQLPVGCAPPMVAQPGATSAARRPAPIPGRRRRGHADQRERVLHRRRTARPRA